MIDNILISALDVAANGSTAATSYDSNSVCNINWTQFIPTMIATVIAFGLTILGTYLYDNYVERKEKKEFIINLRNELNDMLASLSDTQTKLLDKEEIYLWVNPLKTYIWDSIANTNRLSLISKELWYKDVLEIYHTVREYNTWHMIRTNATIQDQEDTYIEESLKKTSKELEEMINSVIPDLKETR